MGQNAKNLRERGILAVLVGGTILAMAGATWKAIDSRPVLVAGLVIDRLSTLLVLLVCFVGAITYRFSLRYLQGESGQPRFLIRMALTILAASILMLANNAILLFVAWALTSLGLHGLLTYDPQRHEAFRPARKKFLISRLGDVALIAAILLIRLNWGTFEITELEAVLSQSSENTGVLTVVGVLIALAALTKSAQFPFHSWLPETMEAPTPVSALMHAGIINAGGALLLRFAPVIVRVPVALLVLSLVGTLTVILGMLAMWSQVKVKRTLAWSTVGQMGFMMVQCGLAVFPAALLHILGHGLYKAWSFLRSSDLDAMKVAKTSNSPAPTLGWIVVGCLASIPAFFLAHILTGFSPLETPGELALTAVLALSIGQVWVLIINEIDAPSTLPTRIGRAAIATLLIACVGFGLYQVANVYLRPVLGGMPTADGPLTWLTALIPIVGLTSLTVFHASLPLLAQKGIGKAFYVHSLHGFYFGTIADRFVDRVWGRMAQTFKGMANV